MPMPIAWTVGQVSKEDVKQLAALEAAIAVEDKAIAKLQRDMAGLNAEAEAVAAALEGVGGAELQEQRTLVETLQQVGSEFDSGFYVCTDDVNKCSVALPFNATASRLRTLTHACMVLQLTCTQLYALTDRRCSNVHLASQTDEHLRWTAGHCCGRGGGDTEGRHGRRLQEVGGQAAAGRGQGGRRAGGPGAGGGGGPGAPRGGQGGILRPPGGRAGQGSGMHCWRAYVAGAMLTAG